MVIVDPDKYLSEEAKVALANALSELEWVFLLICGILARILH